jgi:hypothetical protein
MSEDIRTFWQYLKGPWHSFELHLSATEVEMKEYWDPGKDPNRWVTSLDKFLEGELHSAIGDNMPSYFLSEALESARRLKALR